jgi:hypothetical protein
VGVAPTRCVTAHLINNIVLFKIYYLQHSVTHGLAYKGRRRFRDEAGTIIAEPSGPGLPDLICGGSE